jgi:hypothetical protein
MSSIVISGDTSGAVTVSAPAIAGSNTLTLQAATATSAVNKLETAVTCAGQTSIDFTGIPSWVKRITVMFAGVSTSGTSPLLVQLAYGSSTIENSGYSGSISQSAASTYFTTGFLARYNQAAAATHSGLMTLVTSGSNLWVENSVVGTTATNDTASGAGFKTIGGTLNQIRITTVNGLDTFDTTPSAGTINLLLEG